MSSTPYSALCLGLVLLGSSLQLAGCREDSKTSRHLDSSESSLSWEGVDWMLKAPQVFTLNLTSRVTMPGGAKTSYSVRGELWIRNLPAAGKVRLAAVIANPQVKLEGEEGSEGSQELSKRLAEPLVFDLVDGRVVDTWFSPGTPPQSVSAWRTILSALQLSQGQGNSWKAEEYDSTGKYRAEYKRMGDSDLTRKKTSYAEILQVGAKLVEGDEKKPRLIRSDTSYTLQNGRLRQVEMSEEVTSELQVGADITVASQLSLKRGDVEADNPAFGAFRFADFSKRALHILPETAAPMVSSRNAAEFDAVRMKGRTFESVLEELAGSKGGPGPADLSDEEQESKQARYSAYSALVAFLRSQPGAIDKALRLIESGAKVAPTLVSALGSAGTPEAQLALARVIGDASLPKPLRSRAVMKLGHVDKPEFTSIQVLLDHRHEKRLSGQVFLALGSMGRRFAETGRADQQEEIGKILLAHLKAEEAGTGRVIKPLRALANLGDTRLLGEVKPYLQHTDPRVRAAAISAIQHMRSPELASFMADALKREAQPSVLREILSAMANQPVEPQLSRAVTELLARDQLDEGIRKRAAALMESWSKQGT